MGTWLLVFGPHLSCASLQAKVSSPLSQQCRGVVNTVEKTFMGVMLFHALDGGCLEDILLDSCLRAHSQLGASSLETWYLWIIKPQTTHLAKNLEPRK
jgi:hypothetical protein